MALRDPNLLDDTLTADERSVLAALSTSLKQRFGEQVERVSLFGSRARGDVGPDSDIDVLIVLRVPVDQERRALEAVWDLVTAARGLAPDSFVPLSPVVFSLERFEQLKARERRFALDAEAEGIRL